MISDDINALIELNKYEEAITLLKNICTGALSTYNKDVVIFSAQLNEYNQDVINEVAEDIKIKTLRLNILNFAKTLDAHTSALKPDSIKELLSCSLLMGDSFPFIDRSTFRTKIESALASNKADVILVDGEPKSGMSYLEKFLNNVSNNLDILSFIPIEIPAILGDPDIILGEKLAKYILNEFGLEIEFDNEENEQFKFKQFINILKARVKEDNKVPVFFLHDFHKIEDNNDNLLGFMFTLIKSLKNDFPKCLFIIAGLNYKNIRHWHNDLRFTTTVYKVENIEVDHVKSCLNDIFSKYESKIKTIDGFNDIDKEQYIEGMTNMLIQDENAIDVTSVGLGISEHLLALKE